MVLVFLLFCKLLQFITLDVYNTMGVTHSFTQFAYVRL